MFDFLMNHVCELILLAAMYLSFHQQIKNEKWKIIIRSDGLGYYSYLPAIFIYHDYNFFFIKEMEREYNSDHYTTSGFLSETPAGMINKYYIGVGILWLPFFLIAHFLSMILGYETDGFSQLYQLSVLVAANFYLWLGCKYIRKLIGTYPVSREITALILVLIVFGTNLFHYATYDAWASHVYSFSIISIFIYYARLIYGINSKNYIYLLAFLFSLIILLRPTNAVVLLVVPFFAENFESFRDLVKKYKWTIFKCFFLVVGILSIQLIVYYLEVEEFFVWSYGHETFNFKDPEIFNVLFSYRKGLFIYVPLCFLALGGFIYLFKQNKFQFGVLLLLLILSTYIISSWECWWYGCSLGQRVFIDYYGLLALLLTFLFLMAKNYFLKSFFFIMSPLFLIYSLILSYQYQYYIIHWEKMNKEKFWISFMKTDEQYEGLVWSEAFFNNKEPFKPISFKAVENNRFIRITNDTSGFLVADVEKSKSWETFNLINLENGKVAFRSKNGKLISVKGIQGKKVLKYTAQKITDSEQFELIRFKENLSYIKTNNNEYIVLEADTLMAKACKINDAAVFELLNK